MNAGEGTHFELLMNWMESKELQEAYPDYTDFIKAISN